MTTKTPPSPEAAKRKRVYRVTMTEVYEVLIVATSKAEARANVQEFGGNHPIRRREKVEETDLPLNADPNYVEDE